MAALIPYASGVVARAAARQAASGLWQAGRFAYQNKGNIAAAYETAKAVGQAISKRKRTSAKKGTWKSAPLGPEPQTGIDSKRRRVSQGPKRLKGFRKPKRKPKNNINKFLKYGFITNTEVTGAVNDPDCVYISTQSYPQQHLIEVAVAALLRKLFKKGAEWNCTSIDERIPGYSGWVSNGDGWRIELYSENKGDGTVTTYVYNTATTDTIAKIVGNVGTGTAPLAPQIMDAFFVYSSGYGPGSDLANIVEPFKMRLFGKDGNVTSFWHHRADLNLRCEKIHFTSFTRLRLQNRTVSDGNTNLTNDITCNPIGGKCFYFSNAVPKTKVDSTYLMEIMNSQYGINLQRGASFPMAVQKTTPLKQIFKNCTKVDSVHMNPGEMKEVSQKHNATLTFLTLLRKIHMGTYTNLVYGNGVGKSQMVCLEDDLNFARVQPVYVVYELMRRVGCWAETSKMAPAQGGFTQLTISNVVV